MRKQRRAGCRVVRDQVALREARLRIEDLVEVGEFEDPPVELDLDTVADAAPARQQLAQPIRA